MKIDLIRHAQSIANEKDIFSGTAETPISEEGEHTAIKLAEMMKDKQYTKYFSSPLSRTLRTATLLFPDMKIITDHRLVERGLGQWEGKLKKEMRLHHPQAFLPSGKLHPLFTPPDGEDIPTVATRLMDFLRVQIHDDIPSIVVVTHNGIIRTFCTLVEDLPIEKAFLEAEKNLQIRSCTIDAALLDIMQERHLALTQAIRG